LSPDEKPPSFIDDPDFQKRLSALGDGLDADRPSPVVPPQSAKPAAPVTPVPPESIDTAPAPDIPHKPTPPAPGASIFPDSAFVPLEAPASPVSRFGKGVEAGAQSPPRHAAWTATPGSARPLLDLFPPASTRPHARAPAGIAAPPRAGAGRLALQSDASGSRSAEPLTYEPFYGLSEKAFSLSPDPRFVFHSMSYDRVLQELIDALGRGDPVIVLTGELGAGKTMLCRSLVEQLGRRTMTSFITDRRTSFEALLKTILADFGAVSREETARGPLAAATRRELAAAIGDFAASLAPLESSAVIIVDDAQNVPADILEPLSALADVAAADRRVQIILIGDPSLPSALHRSELHAVEKRIAARYRLDPLSAGEVSGYVAHRLAVAGTRGRVEFDNAAAAQLFAATRGVPRLVNLVCDAALTLGCETSASVIEGRLIATAVADLELVPAGSHRTPGTAAKVLAFLAFMLAGAGVAAWVFRAQLAHLVR
jgi:type II secretory pathway predicted ATPase ExeA